MELSDRGIFVSQIQHDRKHSEMRLGLSQFACVLQRRSQAIVPLGQAEAEFGRG